MSFRYPAAPVKEATARVSFGPDGRTIMLCWPQGVAEWKLRTIDLASPPGVHPERPDPIREFRPYFRHIGYWVDASGQPVRYEDP